MMLNHYIDGLVQERRNSSALAMELRLSCINPTKCARPWHITYPFDRNQHFSPSGLVQYCGIPVRSNGVTPVLY